MDKLESMVSHLVQIASKSNMGIKLAAGLFYSKKGFVGVGYNSTRTYVNKTVKSSVHAEDAVIQYIKSRFHRMKTKNLKIIVIRVSPGKRLLNSKPCLNCTQTIREYGIKKVYYINEENELVCEKIDAIQSYHEKFPYFTPTNIWFHDVYKSSSIVLPIIKKCDLEEEKLTYFTKEMGRKIKELRDAKFWTQEKLAKQLSVSKEVISNIEEGRMEYCKKTTVKLRKFLGDFSW